MKKNSFSSKKKQPFNRRYSFRRDADQIIFSRQKSLLEASKIMNETLDQDKLLGIIMNLATKNLKADRSTLFLQDDEKEEIWSRILQGEQRFTIRLPLGKGLAGQVAKTGETINSRDAHKAPHFCEKMDELTGYHTQTVLCVPMRNRSKKIIGVLQVLNKKGPFFTEDDERFLLAMADHAALAIENTCLYKEAVERQHLVEQLRQAQKMEAVGLLAGGVAHDFNNLLTVIMCCGDHLSEELSRDDPRYRYADEIVKAGERGAGLIHQLLTFSRKQVIRTSTLDLNNIVTNIQSMLKQLIGNSIDVVTKLEPKIDPVKADAGQIEQIIMNLAINARDAMPQGGKITITTGKTTLPAGRKHPVPELETGDYVTLEVTDTGTGMDEKTAGRIFDPFFTTKKVGEGTGLGLSTVYGIAKQSNGGISLCSRLGRGATFTVYLPVIEGETESSDSVTPHSGVSRKGTETILVVDDEGGVRGTAVSILQSHGYQVMEAENGREALRFCREYPHPIHLLIADLGISDMGGLNLGKKLLDIKPNVKVLYMSGYVDNPQHTQGELFTDANFLRKPFTTKMLSGKVRALLDMAET